MKRCPVCGKRHNPLFSQYLLIENDKIISFCSAECKEHYVTGSFRFVFFKFKSVFTSFFPLQIKYSLMFLIGAVFFTSYFMLDTTNSILIKQFDIIEITSDLHVVDNKISVNPSSDIHTDPIKLENEVLAVMNTAKKVAKPDLWDMEALRILALSGDREAADKIKYFFEHSSGLVKRNLAKILASIGDKQGFDYLRSLLSSKYTTAGVTATFALGKLGDRKALRYLRKLMKIQQTKIAAAEIAVSMKNKVAKIILKKIMKKSHREGDRIRAAAALAKTGDTEAEQYLLSVSENSQFRYMVAVGLSRFGNKKATPILKEALKHLPLRIEAAKRLAFLGVYNAYKVLIDDLQSSYRPAKLTAAIGIYILLKGETAKFAKINNINKVSIGEKFSFLINKLNLTLILLNYV